MNTRFDRSAYKTADKRCSKCHNPLVNTLTGERPYCVRCNISVPDWMITGRGR